MSIEVEPKYLEIVLSILEEYVAEHDVLAFGSRVEGNSKEFSDLDIAIKTDSPLADGTMANMKDAFSESNLPFKVDIVDWSKIGENFRGIISKKYEVIWRGA